MCGRGRVFFEQYELSGMQRELAARGDQDTSTHPRAREDESKMRGEGIPSPLLDAYHPRHNVGPGMSIPVFYSTPSGLQLRAMAWGLIPSFTKLDASERPDHFVSFNARSDTITEKPSFNRLLASRRCVVPFNGYFEWKSIGKERQPYYIHRSDGKPLMIAGLWDEWQGKDGPLYSVTILTMDSPPSLTWLHDRTPVLLATKEDELAWLHCSMKELGPLLQRLTRTSPPPSSPSPTRASLQVSGVSEDIAPRLAWHQVSTKMNKIEYEADDVSAPLVRRTLADVWGKAAKVKKDEDVVLQKEEGKEEEAKPQPESMPHKKKRQTSTQVTPPSSHSKKKKANKEVTLDPKQSRINLFFKHDA